MTRAGFAVLGLGLLLLASCEPIPLNVPLPHNSASPLAPGADPAVDGWVDRGNGVLRREIAVPIPSTGATETLIVFRVDPARASFRVHYSPDAPLVVSAWAFQLPDPLLVFNGGYFDESNRATALVIGDGQVFGHSYTDFGGMFGVRAGGPFVRPLRGAPWRPEENLEQAVQGSPVLLQHGDESYTAAGDEHRSRRTVIGQTASGEIVIVIAPQFLLTLSELAAFLVQSGLGLQTALNLDGGSSTGYWAGGDDGMESLTPIPAVVAVYPRGE